MSWGVEHDMMLSSRSQGDKHQQMFVHSSGTSTRATRVKNGSQSTRHSLPLKAIWQIAALGQKCFLQVLLLLLARSNGTSGDVTRPSTVLFIWKNVFQERGDMTNPNTFIWAFIFHMYQNACGVVVSKWTLDWFCTRKCVFSWLAYLNFQQPGEQPVCGFFMGTYESKASRSL